MDLERIQCSLRAALPRIVHWEVDEDILVDYDFSLAQNGLRRINPDDIVGGSVDEEWLDLLVFGVASHPDCGVTYFICVCDKTGIVYGLDSDRTEPKFLLNSSISQFLQTFAFLNRYLQAGLQLPADAEELLREIDQQAYNDSEWRLLIDYLSEG